MTTNNIQFTQFQDQEPENLMANLSYIENMEMNSPLIEKSQLDQEGPILLVADNECLGDEPFIGLEFKDADHICL